MDQIRADGTTVTIIHFVSNVMAPPVDGDPERPPYLQYRIACMPNMTEFGQTPYHPHYPRSDDVRAVTCPACMRSAAFKDSKRALDDMLRRNVRA